MKVEVELRELEQLRQQVIKLTAENNELRDLYKCVDKEELRKYINSHGANIFHAINRIVFKKIGFEYDSNRVDISNILHWARGRYNWEKEVLEVDEDKITSDVIIYLSAKWKTIIIDMGVDNKKL